MVGHKFGEFSPTRTFHGHCRRQESEEGAEVMGKEKHERALADNEAQGASRSMLRISPQKLNLVAQLIRGKKVDDGARRPHLLAQAHRRAT